MKSLVTRIGSLVNRGRTLPRDEDHKSDEVIFKESLLKALHDCQKHGKAVGLYSSALGEGMFVTGVEHIYEGDAGKIIVLKPHEVSGKRLRKTALMFEEIEGACVFAVPFDKLVLNTKSADLPSQRLSW